MVLSCLKYIALIHRTNTRYSSCHEHSYIFPLFATLRAHTYHLTNTYTYIFPLSLPLSTPYPHTSLTSSILPAMHINLYRTRTTLPCDCYICLSTQHHFCIILTPTIYTSHFLSLIHSSYSLLSVHILNI